MNPTQISRVKWLIAPSSAGWLESALADPATLLLDHAHCERKAAGVALQLMFRYPSDGELARALSPLAREELEHFERVQALLERRGIPLKPLAAPPYGAGLAQRVRRQEPDRLLDSLLVAGLIEARSHERMALLARHCADPELRALWGELLASEARHFGLYWLLAERRFPRPLLLSRLGELAAAEHALLATPADAIPGVRMHATGVEAVETDPTPAGR
jgi:tRNA-(ms[2]io[6]A)-hydroxylase